jgi:hypothetical protein
MTLRYQFLELIGLSVIFLTLVLIAPYSANAKEKKCTNVQHPTLDYENRCGARYTEFLARTLKKGECFEMEVKAASKWNASGIRLDPKGKYDFQVIDEISPWKDASIPATPTGWVMNSKEVQEMGILMKMFLGVTKNFRRVPNQQWFYLMGATSGINYKEFPIGFGISGPDVTDGEFCAFANDLSTMYWNNTGSLRLRVTRSD